MINLRGIVRIVLAGSAVVALSGGLTACAQTPEADAPIVEPSPRAAVAEVEQRLALIPEDAQDDDPNAAVDSQQTNSAVSSPSASPDFPSESGNFYMCRDGRPMTPDSTCIGGDNLSPHSCQEGRTLVLPLWVRQATSVDPLEWGPWRLERGMSCQASE